MPLLERVFPSWALSSHPLAVLIRAPTSPTTISDTHRHPLLGRRPTWCSYNHTPSGYQGVKGPRAPWYQQLDQFVFLHIPQGLDQCPTKRKGTVDSSEWNYFTGWEILDAGLLEAASLWLISFKHAHCPTQGLPFPDRTWGRRGVAP